MQGLRSAPTVKQHLACIRMLFDWLVTGQGIPINRAHSVRGPRCSVSKGATSVLSSDKARHLLTGMDVSSVVGLRDRTFIAAMTYSFARLDAFVGLQVEDYFPQKKRWWLRLREKGGKVNEMPCHHTLEMYLDAYLQAAGIETAIGCHAFRATGITDYLTKGGKLEIAQKMAGHANAKTTGLYERRDDDISVSEVERVGI